MLETSARLLKLLSLLQTRRDWPGPELAARLGVSGRTVRRDVERLRELGYRVDALQSMTVPLTGGAPAVQAGTLSAIAATCRGHESLRFGYESGDGTVSERLVEPYRLVASGRRWYLVAFDPGRADWRVFRVDRLRLRTPNGPRFTPREPPAADLAAYASRKISSAPYRYRCVVTVRAPAEAVVARMPPSVAAVDPLDAGSCLLESGANSLDELAFWLVSLGMPFEVREPPELAAHLRALAGRLAEAAGGVSAPGIVGGGPYHDAPHRRDGPCSTR